MRLCTSRRNGAMRAGRMCLDIAFILCLLSVLPASLEAQQLRYNKHLSTEVTTLLDSLLHEDKYDRRFRPDFGGEKFLKS